MKFSFAITQKNQFPAIHRDTFWLNIDKDNFCLVFIRENICSAINWHRGSWGEQNWSVRRWYSMHLWRLNGILVCNVWELSWLSIEPEGVPRSPLGPLSRTKFLRQAYDVSACLQSYGGGHHPAHQMPPIPIISIIRLVWHNPIIEQTMHTFSKLSSRSLTPFLNM